MATYKIPCFCENTFTVEAPEFIDLDAEGRYLNEIMDGTFMNFICTSCGKLHKPEFPITILWPSKETRLEVLPELDRVSFCRQKKEKNQMGETLIGYPELTERLAVLRDDMEPMVIEAIKYYLYLKAEEDHPEKEIGVWYHRNNADILEFQIQGIQEDAIAVTKIPRELYDKTSEDYIKHPKSELFRSLRQGSYLSVKNMMFPEKVP